MKQGKLICVSVGPGDPELLTLAAVRAFREAPVVAAPVTAGGRMLAFEIASAAVGLSGKETLPLRFSMAAAGEARAAEYRAAAESVAARLRTGKDVAMAVLGDVSVYSTAALLAKLVEEKGFGVRMIPGVTSFCAAAGRLGVSLVEGERPLHVLSGREPAQEALSLPGTKVFLKSGRELPALLEAIAGRGLTEKSMLVRNCGLPGEEVFRDLSELPSGFDGGYFSLVIVKE